MTAKKKPAQAKKQQAEPTPEEVQQPQSESQPTEAVEAQPELASSEDKPDFSAVVTTEDREQAAEAEEVAEQVEAEQAEKAAERSIEKQTEMEGFREVFLMTGDAVNAVIAIRGGEPWQSLDFKRYGQATDDCADHIYNQFEDVPFFQTMFGSIGNFKKNWGPVVAFASVVAMNMKGELAHRRARDAKQAGEQKQDAA